MKKFKNVGAGPVSAKKGITLIALIITIIVMLILVSVTITMAINGGLFEKAGQAVGDTRNAINQEQQLADERIKIDGTWYDSIDDYLSDTPSANQGNDGTSGGELPENLAKGVFVEYGVAYTDAYIGKEYSTTNGWRLLDYTVNEEDGTISNVKLISTGIPANLYYNSSDSSTNKSWWVTTESSEDHSVPNLTDFKEVLGGTNYTFYSGELSAYKSLQASAGMYYNFEDIKFAYGRYPRGNNLGHFTSITTTEPGTTTTTTYDSNNNNTVEKQGIDLFKARTDVTDIRLLTLKEAIGRTDIDGTTTVSTTEDSIGLYRLDQLKNVTGMETYDYNNSTNGNIYSHYWLASPYPNASANNYVCEVGDGGRINGSDAAYLGVRPTVCLTSNIHYSVGIETDSVTGMDYYTLTVE